MVAFIAGDLITNNRSFLFGNKNELATIAGEHVTPIEFNSKVEQLTKQFRLQSGKDNPDEIEGIIALAASRAMGVGFEVSNEHR